LYKGWILFWEHPISQIAHEICSLWCNIGHYLWTANKYNSRWRTLTLFNTCNIMVVVLYKEENFELSSASNVLKLLAWYKSMLLVVEWYTFLQSFLLKFMLILQNNVHVYIIYSIWHDSFFNNLSYSVTIINICLLFSVLDFFPKKC
jgi:hypothetical protein